MTRRAFGSSLAALLLMTACTFEDPTRSRFPGGEGQTDGSDVSAPAPTFEVVLLEVFTPHCTRCHAPYSSAVGARKEANAILAAIETDRMPKNASPLPPRLKALVRAWVEGGAATDAPVAPEAPLRPVWSSISEKIFAPKCAFCHQPGAQAAFLDLSTHQAILAARDRQFGGQRLFDFEDPASSSLMTILRDEEEPMPPVWSGLPRLEEDELQILEEWIAAGLPD